MNSKIATKAPPSWWKDGAWDASGSNQLPPKLSGRNVLVPEPRIPATPSSEGLARSRVRDGANGAEKVRNVTQLGGPE